MPGRFSLYPDLSVEENLRFFATIFGTTIEENYDLIRDIYAQIEPFRTRKAGALSGGMKQKLALSTILLAFPEIIILDEPTTGVDPLSRIEFFNIIEELKAEGKTIIIATPYLDEAEKGDEIIFIKDGKILRKGSLKALKETFPAKLHRILPEGDILEVMQSLRADENLKDDVYVCGRYLKYMQKRGTSAPFEKIPAREIREEPPTLEDIYLYYERSGYAGSRAE